MKKIKILDHELSELVDLIYEGPMEKKPWSSSLALLKKYLNANYVTLVIRPTTLDLPGVILSVGEVSAPLLSAYHNDFFLLDPFNKLSSSSVVTSDEMFAEDEWIENTYYKEYLSALNVYRIMGVSIEVSEEMSYPLRVSRPKSLPPFDTYDRELCNYLISHFKRSVSIYSKLIKNKSFELLYERTIDEMMLGVIILSESSDIIKINNFANYLLAHKNGLALKNNRLYAVYNSDGVKLKNLLNEAVSHSYKREESTCEVMIVKKKDEHFGLSVAVQSIPFGSWVLGSAGVRPAVAIFIRDSFYKIQGQDEMVSKLFKLTPAEASLAIKLMNGMPLADAAKLSDIKTNTARAHLRSIFSKVNVTRQIDLSRMLSNSVASFSGRSR